MRPAILAALAILAIAGQSTALVGTRDTLSVGPDATLLPGLAVCERILAAGPTGCETGGVGGATFSVGCAADRDDNGWPDSPSGCLDDVDGSFGCVPTDTGADCDGKDDYAYGFCSVRPSTGAGTYTWRCANDRDDDGLASNVDAWGSNDASCGEQDATTAPTADCYDDEFADGRSDLNEDGVNDHDTTEVCFTRDRAGDDWDSVFVFTGSDRANTYAGTLSVTLHLYPVASCGLRSGHDDGDYNGGEPDRGTPTGGCGFDDSSTDSGECSGATDDGAAEDATEPADDEASANGDLESHNGNNCFPDGELTSWGVYVEYSSGSGSVRATAECGTTVIAQCTATAPGAENGCWDGYHTATEGELHCYYEIVSGNPSGITGYCADPVNPSFLVPMVARIVG